MKLALTAIVVFFLGASLQFGLSSRMALGGAKPDFLLIGACCLSMFSSRSGATVFGWIAGILHGSLVGANLLHYASSRAITCFGVGWMKVLKFEVGVLVAALVVAISTIVAGLIFMFGAGPRGIGGFMADTILSAIYNGVLAAPLFAGLRMVLGDANRQGI